MKHRGWGSAKLLLFGEHAAVYGYPALGLSLPQRTEVEIESGGDSWRVEGASAEDCRAVGGVLANLAKALPTLPGGGLVRIRSGVPRGLGFGSSAALCSALAAAALSAARGPEAARDRSAVWGLAHRAERRFHGKPSGVDTGLSVLGGLWSFAPRPPALPRAMPLKGFRLHLVVGAVPRERNTAALIGGLAEAIGAGDRRICDALARLGSVAERAAAFLESGRPEHGGLGALADEAERDLSLLGLSAPAQTRLLEAGRAAGALGGKLSGAGGGGAFFLVYPDEESAATGAERVRAEAQRRSIVGGIAAEAISWTPV